MGNGTGPRDTGATSGAGPHARYLQCESVNGALVFNLSKATGNDARHLPNALKVGSAYVNGLDVLVPVARLLRAYADEWANPASGGIVGTRDVCGVLGISERTLRRHRYDAAYSYIKYVGDQPATNVGSAEPHAKAIRAHYRSTQF